jgi:hypothetical protein
VDGAVGERLGECVVHASVLVDERKTVEVGAHHGHLEVVAAAGSILDVNRRSAREGALEQPADRRGLHAAMLVAPGYPAGVRLIRALLLFKLGFWAGMFASAALLKRALPSKGDEESNEVTLVAALNGIELKSRARAFRGGTMLSWLGGIAVDLRDAQLAPNAHLDVHSAFGGIAIRVPAGWRVESNVKSLAGGVAVDVPEPDAEDAPTLRLDGFTAFGGIAVGAKLGES